MFGPSVKSVPGWWVSIVPMLIGVPVALTPGFGPHAEVSVAPPLLLDAVVAPPALLLDAEVAAPPLLLLDLLLLPQPASATSATAAMNKRANRIRALAW
jgi:hypothetical protein